MAEEHNVFHLLYDEMPEPARSDLSDVARNILIVSHHLIRVLGPNHPLSQELYEVINNVSVSVPLRDYAYRPNLGAVGSALEHVKRDREEAGLQ